MQLNTDTKPKTAEDMIEERLHIFQGNRRRKILVVEDEMINREILRLNLQDNFDLIFAETGEQALNELEAGAGSLSLVLLDLNLPDMKGVDILRKIKSESETAGLPVIVMTSDQDAEVECLTLGAVDFIPKPYPKQEVIMARVLRTIELTEDRDIIRWTERDSLTGLYNPEYFYRYAAQFDSQHTDEATDAIILDVNHFHILNERYGRAVGDDVLKQIADKLSEAVHESGGIVCRREADTFLVYCPHYQNYEDILKRVAVTVGEDNRIRMRMGVYSGVDKGIDMEHRFDRAKLAADTVKDSFAASVAIYDQSLHEEEMYAEQLLESFKTAIEQKQFTVHYQPKFDVRPKEPVISSAEALVRWKHPELGMISPGVFVPLFEKNGLIRELDEYVWREAAAQIRAWKEKLGRTIPVSINVSRIDLYDPRLQEVLKSIAQEYGLEHSELLLEITESAYTDNADQIINVVTGLREEGFMIEMDDFGTGYSSLNMIGKLPIDALKLDMQFIRTAFQQRKDTRLLEAVIGLAKSLSLPVIAEGVETAEQMFTLKNMGCDIVQGYYFSRPLPADEFEAYVLGLDRPAEKAEQAEAEKKKKKPQDQYTYDAMHDPLTGLYNHSAFDILFHDADHDHIAVLIAHVDDYDDICKEQGKACADQVIRRVAGVLKDSFRSVDTICRLQEAEFVIIISRMTDSIQQLAFDKIEQINRTLQEAQPDEIPVTLSIGVAFSDREEPEGDVFKDADTALKRMEQMKQRGFAVY